MVKKYFNLSNLFLLVVFFIFCFIRFVGLEKRIIFDWDQERDAYVIKEILINKKLTLIGPRVLGPKGFFLGPYFEYLLVPFYWLTKLKPQALIYFLIVYNLTFFWLSFYVLKKYFNFQIALIFLYIWSIHPGMFRIDQVAWNPLLIPLFVIISWSLLLQKIERGLIKHWFLIGVVVGLGINFHFQLIFLLPFVLVIFFFQKNNFKKEFFWFLLGFFLPFLPLIIFDLRHNFLNFKAIANFSGSFGEKADYLAWWPVWANVVSGLMFIDKKPFPLFFYLLVFSLIIYFQERESNFNRRTFLKAFLILWIVFPLGFAIFGQRPSEYYFNFLYPFLTLLTSMLLLKIFKNFYLILVLILIFSYFHLAPIKANFKPNQQSLFYKEKVVQEIARISFGKKTNVSFSVPVGMDTGYRYLLEYYGVRQTQNYTDSLIQIVIPPKEGNKIFGGIGLEIPFELQ